MLKKFRFEIIYFKPNGKYYTCAFIEKEVSCLPTTDPEGTLNPYMQEIVDWLRQVRDEQIESLPNLLGKGWNGHIFVNCEEGYPCLIPCPTA
jgi:hypothetical protein